MKMVSKVKVLSATAMRKLEGLSYADGCIELDFMEKAGESVAEKTEEFVWQSGLAKTVTLLVGKGNNGGDAYVAGRNLLKRGFLVRAFHLYHIDQCGPLCSLQKKLFEEAGGVVHYVHQENEVCFGAEGVILDGLVGTGFKGKAEGPLADMICKANASGLPILAIDIPSGVIGDTGVVETVAIRAAITIYLELPKVGFFLGSGWKHVGRLVKAQFGLPEKYVEQVIPDAYWVEPQEKDVYRCLLPRMDRDRNKYDAGYVLVLGGSYAMSGAAILASYAALKSGAGIIRWFYPEEMEFPPSSVPWEIIRQPFNLADFEQELRRAKALVVGPGVGRDSLARKRVKKALAKSKAPTVIDGDALYFLSQNPSMKIPSESILTPHMGEFKRLLDAEGLKEESFFAKCKAFVQRKKTTLLLKGAPNFLFSPGEIPLILPLGNPGMATAGTGDVLSGIIAGLLAQGLNPQTAAFLGCYLHAESGDIAARENTVYSMTASDLLSALPRAFKLLV